MKIPSFILRKLYVPGSLAARDAGLRFVLRNTLATATLTGLRSARVDAREVAPSGVRVRLGGEEVRGDEARTLLFPRHADAEVLVDAPAPAGRAKVRLVVESAEFGELAIDFEDEVARG